MSLRTKDMKKKDITGHLIVEQMEPSGEKVTEVTGVSRKG